MKNYMIRHKMFETNSSSSHVLCWTDGGFHSELVYPKLGDKIHIEGYSNETYYSWEHDEFCGVEAKAAYLMDHGYKKEVKAALRKAYPNATITLSEGEGSDGFCGLKGYTVEEILFNPKLYVVCTNDNGGTDEIYEEKLEAEKPLAAYQNGNAEVIIYKDGTRKVSWEEDEKLALEYPLNLDIRVSTKCAFGADKEGKPGFCGFCHESASQFGKECDYSALLAKLGDNLPRGIELAIGSNNLTKDLIKFIKAVNQLGFIVNLTVNMGHIQRDREELHKLLDKGFVKGLGVSYRKGFWNPYIASLLKPYRDQIIFHVIAGIDSVEDIANFRKQLRECYFGGKLLVLGEKDFGFHKDKPKSSERMLEWQSWAVENLPEDNEVPWELTWCAIGFDNLAVEQLQLQELVEDDLWNKVYQGEHSFYINAVEQTFSTSSRSSTHPFDNTPFDKTSVKDYYKQVVKAKGL